MGSIKSHDTYLESGKKKAFASAVHWPGWSRSGKDEASAIQALIDYAPRYLRLLQPSGLSFTPPVKPSDIIIVERASGSPAADFGAPAARFLRDQDQPTPEEVQRYKQIFKAVWVAFDQAVQAAQGKQLSKGPRGGGRELDEIVRHVADADLAYLGALGCKVKIDRTLDLPAQLDLIRNEILKGIDAAEAGQLPLEGPRGGKRWTLRFFARYVTWHVVDHAWEIEDRIIM